ILPLQLTDDAAGELSTVFKALANPVRLQMLDILNRRAGEVCVCDIEGHFDLSQPTISHHLRVLRQAGLVDAEQRGTWIYYRVRAETMEQMRAFLGGFCC
ncbi:MAG: metalloregulator ArsR/SmtB family transcription factor, partial [Caldilineaceae bacterium]